MTVIGLLLVSIYRISSNKRPLRLLNFKAVRCLLEGGANSREALISKLGK